MRVLRPEESAMSSATMPSPRIFYGWFVVAAAFAVTFVGFGCAFSFSAHSSSRCSANSAPRAARYRWCFRSRAFSISASGRSADLLADRLGARRLVVAGMVLTGLGLAAAGAARSLAAVYAAYGLGVGVGIGFAYVPAIGVVQRWFVRRRGFASGLAVSGIGVGTLVMPPLRHTSHRHDRMARRLSHARRAGRRRRRRTGAC